MTKNNTRFDTKKRKKTKRHVEEVMKLTPLHILTKSMLWPNASAQDSTEASRRARTGRTAGGAKVAVETDRPTAVKGLQCG